MEAMSVDPTVIAALQAALTSDPDNVALRLHVAELLVQAEQWSEALDHLANILSRQPDHVDALRLAAVAAEASGDKIRAHGYRRLHESLSWQSAKNLIETAVPEPEQELFAQESPEEDDPEEGVRLGGEEPLDDLPDGFEILLPEVTLADVAGLKEVKHRVNVAFLGPMRNPELRKLYGKSLKGGLLLYGPPGCGKTFLARAIAGEIGAKFISVGLTDVVDMWLGQSEKNLHELFQTARRNSPCVLFIDEIDALGRKRSLTRDHAGRTIINQLLAELDGVQSANDGLFVLAATNHPWDVDSALRRPGRLDRTVLVLPPDSEAREAIISHALQDRPTVDIDAKWIAAQTADFSGADIVHIADSAAELALASSMASGVVKPISMKDIRQAMKEIRPSTRSWFETAKNFAVFANEGGIYDDLLNYLRSRRIL